MISGTSTCHMQVEFYVYFSCTYITFFDSVLNLNFKALGSFTEALPYFDDEGMGVQHCIRSPYTHLSFFSYILWSLTTLNDIA